MLFTESNILIVTKNCADSNYLLVKFKCVAWNQVAVTQRCDDVRMRIAILTTMHSLQSMDMDGAIGKRIIAVL